jgi:hypothetical protein
LKEGRMMRALSLLRPRRRAAGPGPSKAAALAMAGARWREIVQRLGPVGWCSAGAVALIAGAAVAARIELNADNARLADRLDELRSQADRVRSGASRYTNLDALSALSGQLPEAEELAAFIQEVHKSAQAYGVEVNHTEYRLQPTLANHAVRARLTMPAQGEYPALRRWLQSLLAKYPTASLDDLALRRAADGVGELEAHVALSITTRRKP